MTDPMNVLSFLRGIRDGLLDAQILAGVNLLIPAVVSCFFQQKGVIRNKKKKWYIFQYLFFYETVPKREDYFKIYIRFIYLGLLLGDTVFQVLPSSRHLQE